MEPENIRGRVDRCCPAGLEGLPAVPAPRFMAPSFRLSEKPEQFGMSIHHVAGVFLEGLPAVACQDVLVLLVGGFGNGGFAGFRPGRFCF